MSFMIAFKKFLKHPWKAHVINNSPGNIYQLINLIILEFYSYILECFHFHFGLGGGGGVNSKLKKCVFRRRNPILC